MQKNKKMWAISLSVMLLSLCAVFGLSAIFKTPNNIKANELPDGVEFVSVIDKEMPFINWSEENGYVYEENARSWVSKQTAESDALRFTPMAENNAEGNVQNTNFNILRNSTLTEATNGIAQNFYIGIGTPANAGTIDANKTYVTALTVNASLNGKRIYINNKITEPVIRDESGSTINIETWFNYFDLTNLYYAVEQGGDSIGKGEKVETPQGTFTFTFNFSTYLNGAITLNHTYTVAYTLLNQSTYENNFPYFENTIINNSAEGEAKTYKNTEANNILNYYYNFNNANDLANNTKNLPYYKFNAELYGLNIVRQYNNLYERITTNFVINADKTGTLTLNYFNANNLLQKRETIEVVANANKEYICELPFEEFGTYTIENFYLVETTSNGSLTRTFQMATGSNVQANPTEGIKYFKNVNKTEFFPAEEYKSNKFVLNNIGFKANFLDYSKDVKELDNYSVITNKTSEFSDDKWIMANVASKIDNNYGQDLTFMLNNACQESALYNSLFASKFSTLQSFRANFPKLNQGPVTFTRFGDITTTGEVSENGRNARYRSEYRRYNTFENLLNGTSATIGTITKDTTLFQNGFYEVIITCDFGGMVKETQAFVFEINRSAPNSELTTVNPLTNEDGGILNKLYTNQNVKFTFPTRTYFEAPIRARVIREELGNGFNTNFSGDFNYVSGQELVLSGNYSIQLMYGEHDDSSVEQFIIDKEEISGLKYLPIDAVTDVNNNIISYIVASNTNVKNANLTSQPFTFKYDFKRSGANITVSYKKIGFEKTDSEIKVLQNNKYVTSDYKIVNKAMAPNPYNLIVNNNNLNEVADDNAFVSEKSGIYLFNLVDAAGNEAEFYVIYDLTKPQIVFNPAIENKYNIVNKTTDIIWGENKAVEIETINGGDETFNKLINSTANSSIQSNLAVVNGTKYITIKNSKVTFEYFSKEDGDQSYDITVGTETSFHQSIYPTANDAPYGTNSFFIGEKDYTVKIIPATDEQFSASLKNIVTKEYKVSMNLDASLGLFHAYYAGDSDNSIGYNVAKDTSINANKLRFSIIPNLNDSENPNRVVSLNYEYYPVSLSDYLNLTDSSVLEYVKPEKENDSSVKPQIMFPFALNPTIKGTLIENGEVSNMSNFTDPTDPTRMFSNIINPTVINGETVTQEGFYIFKRTYDATKFNAETSTDSLERYYAICVTREGIINITTTSTTGKDIFFNMPNGDNDPVIFSAEEIQSYLSNGQINLFNTNKLPLSFMLPNNKYNAETYLNAIPNINADYYNYATRMNNQFFKLNLNLNVSVASFNQSQGTTLKNIVEENIVNLNEGIYKTLDHNGNLTNTTSKTRLTTSAFNTAGNYSVAIEDSSKKSFSMDANGNNVSDNPIIKQGNKLSFQYSITHYSPNGEYVNVNNTYAKRESQPSTTETIFKSTNQKEIYFSFNDKGEVGGSGGIDRFKAEVNPSNIEFREILANGAVSKTYNIKSEADLQNAIANGIIKKVNFNSSGNIVEDGDENIVATNYKLIIASELNPESSIMGGIGNEVTYEVKLHFVGNESDYTGTNNGETVNFFSHTFKITVDRTKPNENLNKLVAQDKFYNSKGEIDLSSYMFAVTDDANSDAFFTFERNTNAFNESDEIFVRKLSSVLNYMPSITPDNPNYKNGAVYPNNPMFEEGNSEYVKLPNYSLSGSGLTERISLSYLNGSGYYEVIERDEAGNYSVYAIRYFSINDLSQNTPNVSATYSYVNSTNTENVNVMGDYENIINEPLTTEILGVNLNLNEITANGITDVFQKVTVNINNLVERTFVSTAAGKTSVSLNEFLGNINSYIENETKTSKPNGYNIKITLTNRFFKNYVINYLVPGEQLKPIFETTSDTLKITIPNDNETTKIMEFHVFKYINGNWSELSTDDSAGSGKPIITNALNANRTSLAGDNYIFGVGEYKFQLIDNFGRGISDEQSFYNGVGVSNIATFGDFNNGTQPAEGEKIVNYTAKPFTFTYQSNYYELRLYKDSISKENLINKSGTDWLKEYSSIVEEVRVNNSVITYRFKNNVNKSEVTLIIQLVYKRGITETYQNYVISIYNILPEINLYNLSGAILQSSNNPNEPTTLTQPFRINWEDAMFSPVVTLTRVYTDENGIQQPPEVINNVPKNYLIDKPGSYTATITNNLGYTHPEYNIYFRYLEDNVQLYSVVAVESGLDRNILNNASNNEVYVDENGQKHPLVVYYATSDFNGTQPNKQIDVRVNTNEQLESYKIPNPSGIETNSEAFYKITSSSDNTSFGYLRYIKIKFVNVLPNFADVEISQILSNGEIQNIAIPNNNTIKTIENKLVVSFNIANNKQINENGELEETAINFNEAFNKINIKVFYRNNFNNLVEVKPQITYDYNTNRASITLTKSGKYVVTLSDLAGNTENFNGGSSNLNIVIANSVLYTINDSEPIMNKYHNENVILKVIKDNTLYFGDPVVSATRNGSEIELEKVETALDSYIFKMQGYYEVTITTQISINGELKDLITVHKFTIINANQSNLCFNIPENYGFRVVKLVKNQTEDLTSTLTNRNTLWLSPADTGSGVYEVTVEFNDATNGFVERFKFNVWIGEEIPTLVSSEAFGSKTKKDITITYNPQAIYSQIGESLIKITGMEDIVISSESPNTQQKIVLTQNLEYWVRITTIDGKMVTSYKITKQEPLNTTAIIIIVVVVIIVVVLAVVFIIMRRHIKFR